MRNEFFIQQWMEKYDIDSLPWRKDIIDRKDPLALFTHQPQLEQLRQLHDDYDLSPLHYYCFIATPNQLKTLLEEIPEDLWLTNTARQSPLFFVGLGGNLETVQWMIAWLCSVNTLSHKISDALNTQECNRRFFGRFWPDGWMYLALSLTRGGHMPIVQWVLSDNFPKNLKKLITPEIIANLFCSGNLELIQWALSENFAQELKNSIGVMFIELMLRCGNLSVIKWLFSNEPPDFIKEILAHAKNSYRITDYTECSPIAVTPFVTGVAGGLCNQIYNHIITGNPTFQAVQWIYGTESPAEIKTYFLRKFRGKNIFQHCAESYEFNLLFKDSTPQSLPSEFKKMLLKNDKNGNTFLHTMAAKDIYYGDREGLYYFITRQPELAASMWVANNNGDTVDGCLLITQKRKNSIITTIQLLKEIVKAAFVRISETYPVIKINDLRLLHAFKEKIIRFLKDPHFMDSAITIKLVDSGALQTIFGELTDKNLKIIFKFFRYHTRAQLQLNSALLNELIIDLLPKEKLTKPGLFCRPSANTFDTLIEKLKKVRACLRGNTSSDITQQAAVLLKLFLMDKRFEDSLCEDDNNLLVALRNILLRSDEISSLMPGKSESVGNTISEADFKKELDSIETVLKITTNTENLDSAMMVLNGIRYLLPHFDELNAFAKANPKKLYYLDKPEQNSLSEEAKNGKLPFHLDEYGTDEELRKTLLRIIREYIAAFYLSKEAGRAKEFFNMTTRGFCLDARVRDLLTWTAQFIGVEDFDEMMEKYIAEYHAYLRIMNNIADPQEIEHFVKPITQFILHYHSGELYRRKNHYVLSMENPLEQLNPRTLYLALKQDQLEYKIIGLEEKIEVGKITLNAFIEKLFSLEILKINEDGNMSEAEIKTLSDEFTKKIMRAFQSKNGRVMEKYLPQLLAITKTAGHTKDCIVGEIEEPIITEYLTDILGYTPPEKKQSKKSECSVM